MKSWRRISGRLKQVSIGETGIWGVNIKGKIFYRVGRFNSFYFKKNLVLTRVKM